MIKRFFKNESGATMVEYAILAALISIAAVVIIYTIGGQVRVAFDNLEKCIATPSSCNAQ